MREIKFRVWHPDEGNMYYFNCFKEITDWQADDFYRADNTDDACVDFMQFTGLHDKNGKEIFEGDIVNCQTKYGKAKAIIKFIDGKFVAYWDSKITHPKNGHHIACYDINKRFEVIGNIYDNKELLNETNR